MKLKQKLYDLLGRHKAKVAEAQSALEGGDLERAEALTTEAQTLSGEIERVKALLAEQERYGGEDPVEEPVQKGITIQTENPEDGYQQAVKAFAQAARERFYSQKAAGSMMQEGVDADGGYTVPEDIVTRIDRKSVV